MAIATYSVTVGSDVSKLHRKVQGKLWKVYNDTCEEKQWKTALKEFELAASLREVTTPVNVRRNGGGGPIVEGGYESKPFTSAPTELTFTFNHENYKYTFSRTSELLGRQGEKSQVFSQIKYQAQKQLESMHQKCSMQTYGFSTGVVCLTSTDATQSSGTYTLIDAYGKSDLDTAAYLSQFFQIGDRVALRRSGSLVTNGIGTITAVGTGTIDVTWNGSTNSDSGDEILFANNLENATLASGTDHNKWPIGLLDVIETASIHGLSSATEALWAAYSDTSGGRFNFVKLRHMQNAIKNNGGGSPDTFICSQGVEADMTDGLLGTNRYSTTMGMQLDGSTAIKGVKQLGGTRWTPASRAWLFDSDSWKNWEPAGQFPDESGNMPDGEGGGLTITDKLQDLSAKSVGVDYIHSNVVNNRGNFAMCSALTES